MLNNARSEIDSVLEILKQIQHESDEYMEAEVTSVLHKKVMLDFTTLLETVLPGIQVIYPAIKINYIQNREAMVIKGDQIGLATVLKKLLAMAMREADKTGSMELKVSTLKEKNTGILTIEYSSRPVIPAVGDNASGEPESWDFAFSRKMIEKHHGVFSHEWNEGKALVKVILPLQASDKISEEK